MALKVKQLIRVSCPLCGWSREFDAYIHPENLPKTCPACGDGEQRSWSTKDLGVSDGTES